MTESSTEARVVSATRVIPVEAQVIFDLLADPARHDEIDGEETVQGTRGNNPERLTLGASFGMDMKFGGMLPYRITNEVVEFEEGSVIAWRHFGHHVWRYELEAVDGGTRVTESFDWSDSRFPPFYEWVGYPGKHEEGMAKTLEKIEELLVGSSDS